MALARLEYGPDLLDHIVDILYLPCGAGFGCYFCYSVQVILQYLICSYFGYVVSKNYISVTQL